MKKQKLNNSHLDTKYLAKDERAIDVVTRCGADLENYIAQTVNGTSYETLQDRKNKIIQWRKL